MSKELLAELAKLYASLLKGREYERCSDIRRMLAGFDLTMGEQLRGLVFTRIVVYKTSPFELLFTFDV